MVKSSSQPKNKTKVDEYNDLMNSMSKAKEKWDAEDRDGGTEDEQDRMLSQAIEMSMEQGRGWSPGEKEAYLEKILDDDFIPPLFAASEEEMEKTGLQEAFTSLIYDGESPTRLMLRFRKKGNDAFADGKRNQAGNKQWFRDAINHYQEALAWALKIVPLQEGDLAQADTDDPTYTESELNDQRSMICSNIALMHLQLKNWGFARDEAQKALKYDSNNIKAWYRLAKAYEMLKQYDDAGDAIDSGLAVVVVPNTNNKKGAGQAAGVVVTTTAADDHTKHLQKLQRQLANKIARARKLRQQRATARAERVFKIQAVWKHCKESNIQLGRTSLVASVTEDAQDDDDQMVAEAEESRWHQHLPDSGVLPKPLQQESSTNKKNEWVWPCMFLYPSHKQSDFVNEFSELELLAVRMAQMFPELEEEYEIRETAMPWDTNNEFTCGNLAVYFEVHYYNDSNNSNDDVIIHPDSVELLHDQGSCMRFYESIRALKGDEGTEMANVVRAMERKHLYQQRKQWKKRHGSLWHRPDPCPIVRVHPAVTLQQILRDSRMVVPNFIVTLIVFPEQHPAHTAFLKEHKLLGILQPPSS